MNKILLGLIFLTACTVTPIVPSYNTSCVTEQVFEVNGESMTGIYENGDEVTALLNYSQCNNLSRNQVVFATNAGNVNPLLKRLVGIPGDQWYLNGSNIILNDELLKNNEGIPYSFGARGLRMLSLYTKDYPIIENNTYLLLGNQPGGSFDATRFGLVSDENIIGVVK